MMLLRSSGEGHPIRLIPKGRQGYMAGLCQRSILFRGRRVMHESRVEGAHSCSQPVEQCKYWVLHRSRAL